MGKRNKQTKIYVCEFSQTRYSAVYDMFKFYYILTYPLTLIALFFIFIYRKVLTHGKAKCCHFLPTCSKYAWDSILEFGAIWGGILAVKRLVRCNPKNKGGIDLPKLNLLGNYKWKC